MLELWPLSPKTVHRYVLKRVTEGHLLWNGSWTVDRDMPNSLKHLIHPDKFIDLALWLIGAMKHARKFPGMVGYCFPSEKTWSWYSTNALNMQLTGTAAGSRIRPIPFSVILYQLASNATSLYSMIRNQAWQEITAPTFSFRTKKFQNPIRSSDQQGLSRVMTKSPRLSTTKTWRTAYGNFYAWLRSLPGQKCPFIGTVWEIGKLFGHGC